MDGTQLQATQVLVQSGVLQPAEYTLEVVHPRLKEEPSRGPLHTHRDDLWLERF